MALSHHDIHQLQVNSALHPSGVAKSSISFGWGKGGKVTAVGWQVTLCDPIWHVISHSGVVISITNCYIRSVCLLFYFDITVKSAYPAVRLNTFHVDSCYEPDVRWLVWIVCATFDS